MTAGVGTQSIERSVERLRDSGNSKIQTLDVSTMLSTKKRNLLRISYGASVTIEM